MPAGQLIGRMERYIFTTKSQKSIGGGGGRGAILSVQQKEGEHGKLLIKTEKDSEIGKLSNFGADITETLNALKPFTSDVLNFIIKMEKLIKAYQPPSSREIGSNEETGHGTSNTCDKNDYLSEKSYSEDETSSIDLFSKTVTTASQDQNSSE